MDIKSEIKTKGSIVLDNFLRSASIAIVSLGVPCQLTWDTRARPGRAIRTHQDYKGTGRTTSKAPPAKDCPTVRLTEPKLARLQLTAVS